MNVISGWGRYPRISSHVSAPSSYTQTHHMLSQTKCLIARGLGRSYGDSSLAPFVMDMQYQDHFNDFDPSTGLLSCRAGVSLDDILHVFIPKGWFLPVTPGTRFVTIGGAIASDIHGKNHHLNGTFTEHITQIDLLLGNGERVLISRTDKSELFHATCGGMGLTGIILGATLRLKPITSSNIIETSIKSSNLESVLMAFEHHAKATYSVAWIDCLAKGKDLGRSIIILGEHAEQGPLEFKPKKTITIPFDMPACLLNKMTLGAFNQCYYSLTSSIPKTRSIPFFSYFYPLDSIKHWNRLYGKSGFLQYQLVIPFSAGISGLRDILERIATSGRGTFLAVLKLFGKENQNHLSFPMPGYSLALDFKVEPGVFQLLKTIDELVLQHGGRLYLTKDARMSEAMFKASYPHWQEFEALRAQYHAIGKFASIQSQRLGLQ